MIPFHHQGVAAEGEGVEPSSLRERTALAERPGKPYPAAFHQVDPAGVEPALPARQAGVFPLDHGPAIRGVGIEPTLSGFQGRRIAAFLPPE